MPNVSANENPRLIAEYVPLLRRTYEMLTAVVAGAEIEDADIEELAWDIYEALLIDGTGGDDG